MNFTKLIEFIKSLSTLKRALSVVVVALLAWILVGCSSLHRLSYSRDGDNVRFEKTDSVRVTPRR